jgi:membrane-associated protein
MIEALKYYLHLLYSFPELISLGGYTALIAIVFTETGLMFGFFLPGDSLLVTAGLFAATGELNIYILLGALSAAAIIGDSVGYFIGNRAGKALFKREDNLFFKKKYLLKAQEFYDKHGGKTIVLARFVPIIRTFAPVVAGIGTMKYKRFLSYNIVGGILWVSSMLLLGFFLGKSIPNIEQNIHFVILIVIFVSFLPIVWEYWKARKAIS